MVFVIWWWRIQNDSCNMTQQKQNKIAFYIPASLDPQTSQNWTTKLPGTSGCAEVWRFGKDDNLTIKKHPIGDEEPRWSSWSNQIWARFLLKKPAFCQFIAEICDKILRPLIRRPLKSEETETCQMLLDNGGIIWMPEKISQMSNPNCYWSLCRYVDFKITKYTNNLSGWSHQMYLETGRKPVGATKVTVSRSVLGFGMRSGVSAKQAPKDLTSKKSW